MKARQVASFGLSLLLVTGAAFGAEGGGAGTAAGAADEAREEARIYLGVGREALKRGDHAEAKAALEAAHRLDPDSTEIVCALGVVLLHLGEFERAADLLGRAVREGVGGSAARRELGVALYRLERHAEAETMLVRAFAADAQDDRAGYYLGLSRYHQGEYGAALEAFEATAGISGPYAAGARLMAGMVHYRLERYDEARVSFAELMESGEQAGRFVEGARTMAELAAVRGRRWNAAVLGELEVDSNVLQAPESDPPEPGAGAGPQEPEVEPRTDAALLWLATAGYRPPLPGGAQMRYTIFLRDLFEIDEQDLLGQTFSLGLGRRAGRHRPGGDYQLQHYFLGFSHYLLAHRLGVRHRYRPTPNLEAELRYRVRFKDFASDYDAFDGIEHGPLASLRWRGWRLRVELQYRFTHEATAGSAETPADSEFSYLGHRAALRLRIVLPWRLGASARLVFERRDYPHGDVLDPDFESRGPRDDERWETGAGIEWALRPRLRLRTSVRHVENASNIDAFGYQKTVAKLGAIYAF